jgi:beta-glucosidase
MRARVLWCLVLIASFVVVPAARPSLALACPYNPGDAPAVKAEAVLAAMTLAQKVSILGGDNSSVPDQEGYVPGIASLCVPALTLRDGPGGVGATSRDVTQLPAPIAAAATWDPGAMQAYGEVVGRQQWGKGIDISLGPTINIARNPVNGRTFESFGEDPYLTGEMAAANIAGIQSQGPGAQVKHYALYNQEWSRTTMTANADERTMREIYLRGFEKAVATSKPSSVMCSYNKINSVYGCQNPLLVQRFLKNRFGFDGFVGTDFGATWTAIEGANAGTDMEMPGRSQFGTTLTNAVANGQVTTATVDEMARRVLTQLFRLNLDDNPPTGNLSSNVRTGADLLITAAAARDSMVLLKNTGSVLPLSPSQSVAVIGDVASDPYTSGGGSAAVYPSPVADLRPSYVSRPVDAIRSRAASLTYAQGSSTNPLEIFSPNSTIGNVATEYLTPTSGTGPGLRAQYFNNTSLTGSPVLTRTEGQLAFEWQGKSPGPGVNALGWSARWSGIIKMPATGTYTFGIKHHDGARVIINGSTVIDDWVSGNPRVTTGTYTHTSGATATITIEEYTDTTVPGFPNGNTLMRFGWTPPANALVNEAKAAATGKDVAIVFVQQLQSEILDLPTLNVLYDQDNLVSQVASVNPNTIVVLQTGSPVVMPWAGSVKGILESWYPGEYAGEATAWNLYGEHNPSGKLPITFPASPADVPASTTAQYPGTGTTCPAPTHSNCVTSYSEGLEVGYRWYDAQSKTPLFPFGFGLSYTTFSFSNLSVSSLNQNGTVTVSARVTNTGTRSGVETAQLYIGFPAAAGEPPKQLKGFKRVELAAGAFQDVTFTVPLSELAYWDSAITGNVHDWTVPSGTFNLYVGNSSRNLPLTGSFTLSQPYGPGLAVSSGNAGVSADATPGGANFDGGGRSFSREALSAAGISAGSTFTAAGVTHTWPGASAGAPNNTLANGQTVAVRGAGPKLSVVGASAVGTTSGPMTIRYTDGTRQTVTLALADWWANTPAPGPANSIVATLPRYNMTGCSCTGNVSLYAATYDLLPGKVVDSVTLPTISGAIGASTPAMHVFSVAVGGIFPSVAAAMDNVGVTSNTNKGLGDIDGIGGSLSRENLAAATPSLTPGGTFTSGGTTYTWPASATGGQPDNILAAGQSIDMTGTGTVGLVGTATYWGFVNPSGPLKVTYTDGTSSTFTLTFADWYASTPAAGTTTVVSATHNISPGNPLGVTPVTTYLFSTKFTLTAGKTVDYITLPAFSQGVAQGWRAMHIFAVKVG